MVKAIKDDFGVEEEEADKKPSRPIVLAKGRRKATIFRWRGPLQ